MTAQIASGKQETENERKVYGQYEPKIPANYEKVMAAGGAPAPAQPLAQATDPVRRDLRRVPHRRTGYFGLSAARSAFDADIAQANTSIAATGATAFTVTAHAYAGAWKAYGGFWLSPWLSLEAGFWNFGGPRYTASVTAPAVATFERRHRARGLGLDLVGWQHASESLSVFGRIGLMYTAAHAQALEPGAGLTPVAAETVRSLNLHPGAGLTYRLSEDFSARLEYEFVPKVGKANRFGSADIHFWSVGVNYSF